MPYLTLNGVPHFYRWITQASQPLPLKAIDPETIDPNAINSDTIASACQDCEPHQSSEHAKYAEQAEHAECDRERPSGDRPVLVFLHGWGGSSRYWEQTARALSDRYDCLIYDLRGFGRSRLTTPNVAPNFRTKAELMDDFALETYAEELRSLLTALQLERVTLNAHSMGASIAALFLAKYPDRVDRAILTCSGIFDYNPLTFGLFHQVGRWVVVARPQWMVQIPKLDWLFMQRFLHRPIAPQDQQAFLLDFVQADFDAALGTLYTSVSKHAASVMPAAFAKITQPTLLIAGEYDQIIPASLAERAAALSPAITYQCLAHTAHFPMLEDVPTYLDRVRSFLM